MAAEKRFVISKTALRKAQKLYKTDAAVASSFGCSISVIRRLRKIYEIKAIQRNKLSKQ